LFKIPGTALILLIFCLSGYGHASGVKTYYKQYSVFTYENDTILCEPYQVKKDDWLYKIFRQKGEISEVDFPRFLNIFKKINPKINNIDAIEPGFTILIPLKKIDPLTHTGVSHTVKMPVVEFSSTPKTFDIMPFVQQHTIRDGDTVTRLIGSQFLNDDGEISRMGRETFSRLNPDIDNIDLIYRGSQVIIPDPSILAQPWFESFLKYGSQGTKNIAPLEKKAATIQAVEPLPVVSPRQMIQLKKYAALIQGTLLSQGKMVLPRKSGLPDLVIDLTRTPLIESQEGKKTLIIPRDLGGPALGNDLVKNIKAYWKQIQIQEIDKIISLTRAVEEKEKSLAEKPVDSGKLIETLLSFAQYPYIPEKISFALGTIEMEASFGRITLQEKPDLLINTGSVYGLALESIEEKGTQILTFSPGLTLSEIILTLFTRLGYSTWKNPTFSTRGRVEPIKGIYVAKDKNRLFFTRKKPNSTAISFLETENIQFLIIDQ
jgi:hypothetical protein